ncbi:MAG: sugar porter family MFS transporter [Chitinophagales bacterium]|nr:sugar porter family MFS transporter [Chitinophagales bacterium]
MQPKNNLLLWTITVALSGFLFGFDTAVISGADQPIQKLWNTSPAFHSWFIMSVALWGTVIGALFGGYPTEKYGRKNTLFWIGILYLVSAIGSGLAWDPYSFSIFRFIGGLGIGASSVAAPIYISEISPAGNRGKLVAAYQFNIVLGILIAFLTNYLIGEFIDLGQWRLMLGLAAVPSLFFCFMILKVSESPRWLILHKQDEKSAKEILSRLNPGEDITALVNEIKASEHEGARTEKFFTKKYSLPIMLAFLLAFFNQLSGINFVLYYAPRIFEMAGLGASTALLSSIGIGVTNLIFTVIGVYLIDRVGRKRLMLIGSIGYVVTLSVIAWAFMTDAGGAIVVIFVFGFIASHAVGQGAVIWVFISEIFPNSMRAFGQAWGTGIHWIFAALITAITLPVIKMLGDNPWPLFAFFAFMMILQLLFTIFMMPETKGVSLEEIEKKLLK